MSNGIGLVVGFDKRPKAKCELHKGNTMKIYECQMSLLSAIAKGDSHE